VGLLWQLHEYTFMPFGFLLGRYLLLSKGEVLHDFIEALVESMNCLENFTDLGIDGSCDHG